MLEPRISWAAAVRIPRGLIPGKAKYKFRPLIGVTEAVHKVGTLLPFLFSLPHTKLHLIGRPRKLFANPVPANDQNLANGRKISDGKFMLWLKIAAPQYWTVYILKHFLQHHSCAGQKRGKMSFNAQVLKQLKLTNVTKP